MFTSSFHNKYFILIIVTRIVLDLKKNGIFLQEINFKIDRNL